jgi:hypothetical protein
MGFNKMYGKLVEFVYSFPTACLSFTAIFYPNSELNKKAFEEIYELELSSFATYICLQKYRWILKKV